MANHYMQTQKPKEQAPLAIKNIMANLKAREGSPTANKSHTAALHKMLEHYLNGGS
jgi:hypothetical protein